MNHRPLVIAHRGASAEAPENTLAAFRLALEQGCDAIELDIHLSADARIIVCHDETVDRTTNGAGAMAELTASELRRFDAGSWFGAAFSGERLPLLEEVLDLVPAHIGINIEVKSDADPIVNRVLVELLERRGRMDSVFFSSFGHECMVELKKLAPSARIGLLYEDEPFEYRAFFERYGIEGYALHPHHQLVDPDYVHKAAREGLRVFPWTVDEPQRMRELIRAGVTGIISNQPGVLRGIVEAGGDENGTRKG